MTWIGSLLALGARLARLVHGDGHRKLVVAVSVPRRDFAAAIIATGWSLAREPKILGSPLEVLRLLERGQGIRAVNDKYVVTGAFGKLHEAAGTAFFAESWWHLDEIRAVTPLRTVPAATRMRRPNPGSIARFAHVDGAWDVRLAAPPSDLALIGTRAWLELDLQALLGVEGDDGPADSLSSLLLPDRDGAASMGARVLSCTRLAENLPLPDATMCAILDGSGAIEYLSDIDVPAVVCVVDRSVADDRAAETLVGRRVVRGAHFSVSGDLRWSPPRGIEAMAYTEPL
ncbi:hypothetical protein [Demequina aestuarii]|uniref:hypothetical protein n=1 Tax=Demequina aestuarii TaxID=327095 RepID=UPI001EE74F92|nr:hypothetical protein [Demequina aestuarii]